MLLMLGGLMLLHLGSLWVHGRALHGAENSARVDRLAERLSAAALAISAAPEIGRDAAAHALSLPGIELHWERNSPVPEGTPATELAPTAMRLGAAARLAWDPNAAPGHRVIGALPVEAGGWLVFSATWFGNSRMSPDFGTLSSMAAMALGIALLSALVIRWITMPLRRLADAADGIGRDLSARPMPTDGPSEVRHAAVAFNAMQERIRLLVEDRTEALAAVSHDLRTPLARLKLRAGFLPEGEERARIEDDIVEMEAMVARTLDYIREGRDAEPTVQTDLAAILQTLASDASDAGHEVAYSGPARAVLPLRRVAAKRAFANLVDNAVRHGAEPVRLTIRMEQSTLLVEVSDGGPGIAADDRTRALAPFKQLDPARGAGGSGLGLSISQRFAEASGGTIELGVAEQGGLSVRITLPRSSA